MIIYRAPLLSAFVLLASGRLLAQSIPIALGTTTITPPAIDASGQRVAFASSIPSGSADVYVAAFDGSNLKRLTNFGNQSNTGANAVALSPDGSRLAYTMLVPGNGEQVHVIDVSSGADRTVVKDNEGCIQPLAICPACFFYCVNTPHLTADGSKILYSVRRQQPFRLVNADGSGLVQLPVFSGSLAPGPQRVISTNGTVVFTSQAPSGPTFAASATDVYVMNLDGSNLRNLTQFGINSSIFAANAVISGDGSTVAFETNYAPNVANRTIITQIWTVRTDGTGLRRLTAESEPSSNPSINGDGSLVVFFQSGRIWMARTDGRSSPVPVTTFPISVAQDPALSADGSRIAFALGPGAGERGAVYTVAIDGSALHAVYAPPTLNVNGVASASGFAAPSAGSLITAYGLNLSTQELVEAKTFPLPPVLAGVNLLANGQPLPLLAVTPWQINAQLPQEAPEATATFQARFADGSTTPPVTAQVKSIAPAVFFYAASTAPGVVYWQAAAYHAGTAVPADSAHPAQAGDFLEIYGTGLGLTNPRVPAGAAAPASPPASTVVSPQVLIGDRPANVLFSGLAPGLAGVYQVNVVVPGGLSPGLHPIRWLVGTAGESSASIAVR
jgi:uncharacterized protein (TIGR03437 family)